MQKLYQVYYGKKDTEDGEKWYETDIDTLYPTGRPMSFEDAKEYIKKMLVVNLDCNGLPDLDDEGYAEMDVAEVLEDFFEDDCGEIVEGDLWGIQFGENDAHMYIDQGEIHGSDPCIDLYVYKILPYKGSDTPQQHLSIKDWAPGNQMVEIVLTGDKDLFCKAIDVIKRSFGDVYDNVYNGDIEALITYPLEGLVEKSNLDEEIVFSFIVKSSADDDYERMQTFFDAVSTIKDEVTSIKVAVRAIFEDPDKDGPGELFLYYAEDEDASLYDPLEMMEEDEGKDIRDYWDISWIPQIWKDEMV